jgi:hypothetical protein
MDDTKIEFYFSQGDLAERYHVDERTIQRWRESRKLPPATTLPSGRPAWANTVIEAHERALVGAANTDAA